MRNGDYFPTRMEAQVDALNWLMNTKYGGNPENTVGILKMAKGVETLVTPTPRIGIGKILSAMHSIRIGGEIDLLASIQIAQLVLKHRQNKNQHQRMVLFISSPLGSVDSKALIRIGKALKKNNVAVDVVNFGEPDANQEILTAFVNEVNSNNNSTIVTVPVGGQLKEVLRGSPISEGTAGGSAGAAGGGEFGEDDPDLMAAINASIED